MFKMEHLTGNMGLGKYLESLNSLGSKDFRLKGYLAGLLQIADATLNVPNKTEIMSAYQDYLLKNFSGLSDEARASKMKEVMTIQEFTEKYNSNLASIQTAISPGAQVSQNS